MISSLRFSKVAMILFYLAAGINHFINPEFYLPLIPDYLPYHELINLVSGYIEIVLAAALLFNKTQRIASFAIIAMLLAFIPSHIYFIQINSCIPGGLCVATWIGWIRLVIVHPLLVYWAWSNRK